MPFFRPNAVTLINVFDRGLIRNALFECERSPGDIHWTAGAEEGEERSSRYRACGCYNKQRD